MSINEIISSITCKNIIIACTRNSIRINSAINISIINISSRYYNIYSCLITITVNNCNWYIYSFRRYRIIIPI